MTHLVGSKTPCSTLFVSSNTINTLEEVEEAVCVTLVESTGVLHACSLGVLSLLKQTVSQEGIYISPG